MHASVCSRIRQTLCAYLKQWSNLRHLTFLTFAKGQRWAGYRWLERLIRTERTRVQRFYSPMIATMRHTSLKHRSAKYPPPPSLCEGILAICGCNTAICCPPSACCLCYKGMMDDQRFCCLMCREWGHMAQFALSLWTLFKHENSTEWKEEHRNCLKVEAGTVAEINLAVSPALTFNEH